VNPVLEKLLQAGTFTHRGQTYPIAHATSATICRRYADLIVEHKLKRGLEIGTLFGFSTLFLADAFSKTNGALDTVDIRYRKRTWSDGSEIEDIHEVAERLIVEADLEDIVTFHAGDSNQILAEMCEAGKRYDFALVDGSHKFGAALLDFIAVDSMLDREGYVAIDDVGVNVSAKDGLDGGPNRLLAVILTTNRYKVKLWSANVAVCQKVRDV
jgi:predicted O-methyltransferase YrrM